MKFEQSTPSNKSPENCCCQIVLELFSDGVEYSIFQFSFIKITCNKVKTWKLKKLQTLINIKKF